MIGHEFSHILNGDMRLNIRLIGLLNGILLISLIGLRCLQFGVGAVSDRKNGAPIVVIAVAMMVLGFVGVFFANLIKAAVSRPARVAGRRVRRAVHPADDRARRRAEKDRGRAHRVALRDSRGAAEVSHMLFGEGGRSFASLLTTPPAADEPDQGARPELRPGRGGRAAAALRPAAARRVGRGLRSRIYSRRNGIGPFGPRQNLGPQRRADRPSAPNKSSNAQAPSPLQI